MKNQKEDLINNLIFLTSRKDDLWLYHPKNMKELVNKLMNLKKK